MSSNDPVGAPDTGGPTPEVTNGQRGIESPQNALTLYVRQFLHKTPSAFDTENFQQYISNSEISTSLSQQVTEE